MNDWRAASKSECKWTSTVWSFAAQRDVMLHIQHTGLSDGDESSDVIRRQ